MKKRIIALMLVFSIIMQFSFVQPSAPLGVNSPNVTAQTVSSSKESQVEKTNSRAPFGGVENIKANAVQDSGFETSNAFGGPTDFSVYGTSSVIVDSQYQTEVYAGNYGAFVSAEATPQFASSATNARQLEYLGSELSYIDEDINLNLWYNCKSNPDINSNAKIYFYILMMSDIGNLYFYYYLSSLSFPSDNDTYNAYYDLRGSLNTWTNINRNFTNDFVSAFPLRNISMSYIRQIQFTCSSPSNPTGPTALLFDEVSITNGTGFNYVADNGDFESGDSSYWSNLRRYPGSAYTTTEDYSQGKQSLNVTAYSNHLNSYSEVAADYSFYDSWHSMPKGFFALEPGDVTFSFDWKYSDTLSASEYAYAYLSLANNTVSGTVFFILGDGQNDTSRFSNSSGPSYFNYYIKAEHFGARDTWQHFSIDLFEIIEQLGLSNMVSYFFEFYGRAGGVDSKMQLLVDEFEIVVYPANDPSFENSFYWSTFDPIIAWQTPNQPDYVNITTDAFNGNYAARVTSFGSYGSAYCRRNIFLPVENNQYTDFMWKLDQISCHDTWAYAFIKLRLAGGRSINYLVGRAASATLSNDSLTTYYTVANFNQTGVWNNIFRNLSNDVYTAFGPGNWNITQIEMISYGQDSNVVSAIYDNLHFVTDVDGPTISDPAIDPSAPEYGELVNVSVNVVDSTEVTVVHLHYKIGAEPWDMIPMVLSGSSYRTTIPDAEYATTVSYYFEAEDIHGHLSYLGSPVSPYTYNVGDTVAPVLSLEAPSEAEALEGIVRFNITEAYDLGSGVFSLSVEIDGSNVYFTTNIPAYYEWNTTDYPNDDYPILFILEDHAGNNAEIGFLYTVSNTVITPTPSSTPTNSTTGSGSLPSGYIALLSISTLSIFVLVIERKRKYKQH